ncbi:hypothetical protein ACLK1T_07560 [Escherichia coli]
MLSRWSAFLTRISRRRTVRELSSPKIVLGLTAVNLDPVDCTGSNALLLIDRKT